MSESKMNPKIKVIEVGKREVRKVHIYPLSMQDQFDLTNDLAAVIEELGKGFDFNELTNENALEFLHKIISDNLEKVLEYVTDEDERPTFKEITNDQFYVIIETIFENNYEGLIKNSINLFQRVKKMVQKEDQKKVQ